MGVYVNTRSVAEGFLHKIKVYKVIIVFVLCTLICACNRRVRTPIGGGYYYSSSENNKIDGMGPVDLEFSETGRTFITIGRNLYPSAGGVVVHDKLAVFSVRGNSAVDTDVFAATPRAKPVNISPVIEKKWDKLPFSKAVHWKKDYFLLKITGTADTLSLRIAQRRYLADFPETVTLNIDWPDIEFLTQEK